MRDFSAARLYLPTLCPCCGRYLFEEKGKYEICPVCGWEDDPIQRREPDYKGGANAEGLRRSREIYLERTREVK